MPLGENGDTYDRYVVRIEEMRQSRRIIQQVLKRLPDGPVRGKAPKIVKPPAGEYYSGIESPRGELGYYIVSDGSARPFRVRIRPPTFIGLPLRCFNSATPLMGANAMCGGLLRAASR